MRKWREKRNYCTLEGGKGAEGARGSPRGDARLTMRIMEALVRIRSVILMTAFIFSRGRQTRTEAVHTSRTWEKNNNRPANKPDPTAADRVTLHAEGGADSFNGARQRLRPDGEK